MKHPGNCITTEGTAVVAWCDFEEINTPWCSRKSEVQILLWARVEGKLSEKHSAQDKL